MHTNHDIPRMKEDDKTDAVKGLVKWAPVKSIWYLSHLFITLIGGVIFFSWSAVMVFLLTTLLTLCLGHSLGMHRKLIHNSYDCPKWLEYIFVYLGVLIGMAGPIGMIFQHDIRDWAQRKSKCHSYLRHGKNIFLDGWWQLNCDLILQNPPELNLEKQIKDDKVYSFMEKTWMLQQLPLAIILFYLGGIAWVVWGISARVTVSVTGHWFIGYFAHNQGEKDWQVQGAAVQGHNIPLVAFLSMGEAWHNNHHAFPGSAMLGIYTHQTDPGWWVLNRLMNIGLVWDVKLPKDLPERKELLPLSKKLLSKSYIKIPQSCSMLNLFK